MLKISSLDLKVDSPFGRVVKALDRSWETVRGIEATFKNSARKNCRDLSMLSTTVKTEMKAFYNFK